MALCSMAGYTLYMCQVASPSHPSSPTRFFRFRTWPLQVADVLQRQSLVNSSMCHDFAAWAETCLSLGNHENK